jgi:hypothetical protein
VTVAHEVSIGANSMSKTRERINWQVDAIMMYLGPWTTKLQDWKEMLVDNSFLTNEEKRILKGNIAVYQKKVDDELSWRPLPYEITELETLEQESIGLGLTAFANNMHAVREYCKPNLPTPQWMNTFDAPPEMEAKAQAAAKELTRRYEELCIPDSEEDWKRLGCWREHHPCGRYAGGLFRIKKERQEAREKAEAETKPSVIRKLVYKVKGN